MNNLAKYGIVAVLAFLIGSVAVVSAQGIEKLVISNEAGTNSAKVNNAGRLQVKTTGNVRVSNLPATQDVRITNTEDLQGAKGDPGQACWDLNNNGIGDVGTEDTNGDGDVDVQDCRGDDFEERFGNAQFNDRTATGTDTCQDRILGEVWMFAGTFAPRGTAFAHDQLLPISQHNALFSLLGTIYGGDGRTTFGLPDLEDLAPDGVNYVICLQGLFPS